MRYIIGIDLDNTIVSYDELIHKVALELGLIAKGVKKSKRHVRDYIWQFHGDEKWQEVQAVIYGPRMREAKLIDGVDEFFRLCAKNKVAAYIISHKTEFSNYYKAGANFREAALDWMERNNFFKATGLSFSKGNVYFESTRQGKLQRIKQLGCTHFIDDLEETFRDGSFPAEVERILYDPHGEHLHLEGVRVFRSWSDVSGHLFKSRG